MLKVYRTKRNCKICGNETNYDLCKECHIKKEIIKNDNYNSYIHQAYINEDYKKYKNDKKNEFNYNSCVMIALAEIMNEKYDNSKLLEKVYDDIADKNPNNDLKIKYYEIKCNETNNLIEKSKIIIKLNELCKNNNCKYENTNLIDDYRKKHPAKYRCKDGHYVRSTYEKIVDDYLYEKKIFHEYERCVYDKQTKEIFAIADFFLPYDKGIYIEIYGMNNIKKYDKKKEYKQLFYAKNKYKIIEITKEKINHLDDILNQELMEYINNITKMNPSL